MTKAGIWLNNLNGSTKPKTSLFLMISAQQSKQRCQRGTEIGMLITVADAFAGYFLFRYGFRSVRIIHAHSDIA